jgi:hypothetical protein
MLRFSSKVDKKIKKIINTNQKKIKSQSLQQKNMNRKTNLG